MVSIQDKNAGPIVAQAKGGFPQRFIWSDVIDATIPPPHERPAWPGPLPTKLPTDEQLAPLAKKLWSSGDNADDGVALEVTPPVHLIPVTESVREEIQEEDWKRATGQKVDEDSAHLLLKREKTAFGLAWLTEARLEISEEDWQLAGMIMEASGATYERIEGVLAAEGAHEGRQADAKSARRRVAEVAAEESWRIHECAKRIRAKVKERPGISRGDLYRSLPKWRNEFDDGLGYALSEEWITEKNTPSHTGDDKREFYPAEMAGKG
jgi:hypothetical protein